MRAAQALILTSAAAVLLVASRRTADGAIEAGEGDILGTFQPGAIVDSLQTVWDIATEAPAMVDQTTAERNMAAFFQMIIKAEGTDRQGDPYRTCFGYRHVIRSFADHPAVTREWTGERLSDEMCANAGFGPGCVSTAAGAAQIIRPTWIKQRDKLGLPDFGPESQRRAFFGIVSDIGALRDVQAGRFTTAVRKCASQWASLPGNKAKQGQRDINTLAAWYGAAGGSFA